MHDLSPNFINQQQQQQQRMDNNNNNMDNFCWHIYKQQLRASECRLVVFSEKDTRLLYDSATVVALADRFVFGSHLSQCGRFQFLPHKYDTLKIAKMLFGTMPAALKSDSLKIHTLKDSNSVMISRVFSVPKLGKYSSTPFKTKFVFIFF
ncbi:unnamed protein product [Meloidogyne enterolobii]|uniref:Uncharacterized protein n=1 Tax=Meloidogyne enterolobii TaxID=390850 RepID=A0ACB1B5P8_MELEN